MKLPAKSMVLVFIVALGLGGLAVTDARADGTETLGPPSVAIEPGTGFVAAGTGMVAQPGSIDLDVPAGVTVKQVLLYWNAFNTVPTPGDDTLSVNGTPVTGSLIGGPTVFFFTEENTVFRADITALGMVAPGMNTLVLTDLSFTSLYPDAGAGALVIIDDGGTPAEIGVADGSDLAFFQFASPLDTTVPQTFGFTPVGAARTADLVLFAGSVFDSNRPNRVDVTVDGVTTQYVNVFGNFDGDQWDTVQLLVDIPADASSLTVQALSVSDGSENLPASLSWVAAGLSVPPGEGDGEGCTPGFWKNVRKHGVYWVATGYSPGDDFDAAFGVDLNDPDITLLQALKAKGGGLGKLLRHGTAALLNASHPDVDYPLSAAEVIAAVQAGDADALADFNEDLDCPLSRPGGGKDSGGQSRSASRDDPDGTGTGADAMPLACGAGVLPAVLVSCCLIAWWGRTRLTSGR